MAAAAASALTEAEGLLILWASIDPTAVDEGALNDWWTNEHLPERLSLPGFKRARRYRALQRQNGQNEYLALYQTSNLRHLASSEYLHALNHPTRRTTQFMPSLAKMSRFACESISKSLSVPLSDESADARDRLFMVVFQVAAPGLEHDLFRAIGEHIDSAWDGTSVATTQAQLAKVNEQVTNIGSASKSYDRVRFKSAEDVDKAEPVVADTFIALYEFRSNTTHGLTANNDVVSKHLSNATNLTGLRIKHINTYELIASLDRLPVSP